MSLACADIFYIFVCKQNMTDLSAFDGTFASRCESAPLLPAHDTGYSFSGRQGGHRNAAKLRQHIIKPTASQLHVWHLHPNCLTRICVSGPEIL